MQVLTNSVVINSAADMWVANVGDLDSVTMKVKEINGSTLTIETSPDNSVWTALSTGFNLEPTYGARSGSTVTAVGRYLFPADTTYFRIRCSTYVGQVTIEVDVGTYTPRSLTAMLITGLVAQGSTQANAVAIQGQFIHFGTVNAGTGAILPAGLSRNTEVVVKNGGANALAVYPPVGYAINGGSVNAAFSLASGSSARFISVGDGNFYSF